MIVIIVSLQPSSFRDDPATVDFRDRSLVRQQQPRVIEVCLVCSRERVARR